MSNFLKRFFWAPVISLGLLSCEDTSGRLSPLEQGVSAPSNSQTQVDKSVDGLIVGHRLMAAGEFELALRSYTRAAADRGFTVDILSALGSANLKLGRLGQAEKLLEAAVKKDETFVAAWNNLGVVLSSQGNFKRAEQVFKLAFALDSGKSDEIRTNLTKAIAQSSDSEYISEQQQEFELVRRGNGRYLLLQTPKSE